jgi:hypothetical protein
VVARPPTAFSPVGGRQHKGIFNVKANNHIFIFLKPYKPPNMTKSSKIRDERVNKAAEFARLNKNLSIAEIARQFEVPYRTLYGRVRDNKGPRSA